MEVGSPTAKEDGPSHEIVRSLRHAARPRVINGLTGQVIAYRLSDDMQIRLREWRDKRGYSVGELARRSGVNSVSIVKVENDRMSPTVQLLEKLARALRIGVRNFFPVQ